MLTLINLLFISVAIGNAEGNVTGFTPTSAYMGHVDPAVKTLGITREDNYGLYSIASSKYKLSTELTYFNELANFLRTVPDEYSLWVLLNIADLYVQSPAATKGWDDSKSTGLGFLYGLRSYAKVTTDFSELTYSDLENISKIRTEAFINTDGINEGFVPYADLYQDQLRRVTNLRETYIKYKP